ncbi:MAG TPA: hypothetical protein DDZ41_11055, partial [Flavobacterium sp.]|nr:hypothetical protein [Flavobacterium sp.]
YRYNFELKKTAAHTIDRTVLFNFISDTNFKTIDKELIEKQQNEINDIFVENFEILNSAALQKTLNLEQFKTRHEKNEIPLSPIEEKLEINTPLHFDLNERHSFFEWLQLTKIAPINRDVEKIKEKTNEEKKKKLELIDKFIVSNPKIGPIRETTINTSNIIKNEETSHLMTETLARIYLEQKKYSKAIQAYEILILKYPEKSIFFADRIKNIKELQQNK